MVLYSYKCEQQNTLELWNFNIPVLKMYTMATGAQMVLQLYRVRNHHVAWCGVAVIPCEPLEVVCTMRSRLHQSLFMSDDYSVDCLISIVDDISHITKMLEHQTTCLCPNALGNAHPLGS